MKNILLIVIMGLTLLSCQPNSNCLNEENINVVKSYIQSVEELDYNTMSALLDENYLGMGPSYGDSIGKMAALANWEKNTTVLYESIKYKKSRCASFIIADGDNKGEWVANWAELNIIYKNNEGNITIIANTNYQVENGKIVKSITFYNEADALRQLGYEFIDSKLLNQ